MLKITAAMDRPTACLLATARAVKTSSAFPTESSKRIVELAGGIRQAVLAREFELAVEITRELVEIVGTFEEGEPDITSVARGALRAHSSKIVGLIERGVGL